MELVPVIPVKFDEELYVEMIEACSAHAGKPRWKNDWRCPGRYYAEIFKFDTFGFTVEDTEDAENDELGFATFTIRRIKIFSISNILLLEASQIIQGIDEYKDSNQIQEIQEAWQIHRVTPNIEQALASSIIRTLAG
ncbi:MAG: hypothetical protein AB8G77_08525 [Rhodothermales bacterium]